MNDLKLKKIKPINSQILTTADKYEEDGHMELKGAIIHQAKMKGTVKLYQKVLAAGSLCRYVKEGDVIQINPIRYVHIDHPEDEDSIRGVVTVRNDYSKYSLPTIKIDGETRLLINEQDVEYIIEDYEEV